MPIRLIAVDIDGTLLDSRGKLPAVNRQAVHDALGAGVVVTLVTGRTYHHAQPVATALAPQGDALTLIVSNGALIKRANGETLHRSVLERSHAREIIETVRQRRAGAALIFDRPGAEQYIYEGIDWQHPNRRAYYERNKVFMTDRLSKHTGQKLTKLDLNRLLKNFRKALDHEHLTSIDRRGLEDHIVETESALLELMS